MPIASIAKVTLGIAVEAAIEVKGLGMDGEQQVNRSTTMWKQGQYDNQILWGFIYKYRNIFLSKEEGTFLKKGQSPLQPMHTK